MPPLTACASGPLHKLGVKFQRRSSLFPILIRPFGRVRVQGDLPLYIHFFIICRNVYLSFVREHICPFPFYPKSHPVPRRE